MLHLRCCDLVLRVCCGHVGLVGIQQCHQQGGGIDPKSAGPHCKSCTLMWP